MKFISESKAIEKLRGLKRDFAAKIRSGYEHRAKSCSTCETKGACCLDAHFVNVHITRLEAKSIIEVLKSLPGEKQRKVFQRIGKTVERYDLLSDGDSFAKTYACPLFEPEVGCLIHKQGKPLACIHHACYENARDLPPDALLHEAAEHVEHLNYQTYGRDARWLPLPVALLGSEEICV